MICAANYARVRGIPYFGICLGMQIAVMSYARNVLGYADANSGEFDPNTSHPVIDLMESQHGISKKGGTMRLGAYPCKVRPGSIMASAYGSELISERHRHRYEFNNAFREEIESSETSGQPQRAGGVEPRSTGCAWRSAIRLRTYWNISRFVSSSDQSSHEISLS